MTYINNNNDNNNNNNNNNRTEWIPIRSSTVRVIDTGTRTTAKCDSDSPFTNMIADRIGRHEVLLPINHNRYNI